MKKITLIAIAILIAAAGPAFAQKKKDKSKQPQGVQRIAAVVNDDVISIRDLVARLKVIIVTSRVKDSIETRKRLAPQVLKALIDETLQLQEARRLNVKITKAEIDEAWARLEKQNKMPKGGLEKFLRQKNIPKSTIVRQIQVALLWSKVVRQRVRPRIRIGEDEVNDVLEQIESGAGQTQYRFLEIFLPIDSPDAEGQVKSNAARLVAQLRRGANFQVMARQFSKSETARVGGDTGYVSAAQINPDILKVLEKMKPQTLSPPIRTATGYYIVALLDRKGQRSGKAAAVAWRVVSFPHGTDTDGKDKAAAAAKTVATEAKSCGGLSKTAKAIGGKVSELKRSPVAKLKGETGAMIKALKKNEFSAPLVGENATRIVIMCDRTKNANLPSRNQVMNILAREQVNIQVRRYMRDLRLAAFLDIRV